MDFLSAPDVSGISLVWYLVYQMNCETISALMEQGTMSTLVFRLLWNNRTCFVANHSHYWVPINYFTSAKCHSLFTSRRQINDHKSFA